MKKYMEYLENKIFNIASTSQYKKFPGKPLFTGIPGYLLIIPTQLFPWALA